MKRKIVRIDEDKCNGCGECVPACVEGAIKIINGKARLAADNLCDGLGACLGECPQDAITIEEREAPAFDEKAVAAAGGHAPGAKAPAHAHPPSGGCPGARLMNFNPPSAPAAKPDPSAPRTGSQLGHWPVKLELVPPGAPFLQGANLLVAADCVPFAYPEFHRELLAGHAVVIGCPKLNDQEAYLERLTAIFAESGLRSVTVAHMEVPCCFALAALVKDAIARSGKKIPFSERTITLRGSEK